jgi:hypothetical protein
LTCPCIYSLSRCKSASSSSFSSSSSYLLQRQLVICYRQGLFSLPVYLPLHLLPLALPDCLILVAPLADLLQRRLAFSDARLCTCSTSGAADSCSISPPTSGQTRPTSRPVAVGVQPNRTTHFLCRAFQNRACIEGERYAIQAPSQLCSLLHFRFHHRLELRIYLLVYEAYTCMRPQAIRYGLYGIYIYYM